MRLPTKRGTGHIPRYGGGWMHQFGHTYLLQQELLNKTNADWFRAVELWHTARHEGLALNISHYTNILQHTAIEEGEGTWRVALDVLRQMRRDAIRADCRAVGMALSILANDARWKESLETFAYFSSSSNNINNNKNNKNNKVGKYSGVGMKMDSLCVSSVIRACVGAKNANNTNNLAEDFVRNLRNETKKSVCPAVDSFTINAALDELKTLVRQEEEQEVKQQQQHALESQQQAKTMLLNETAFVEDQQQQEESAEVLFVKNSNKDKNKSEKMMMNTNIDSIATEAKTTTGRSEEAIKRWKAFFERMQ